MKIKKHLTITIVMAALLLAAFLVVTVPVQAAEIIDGDQDNPHVEIDEPVDDDLIVTAEKITVNAPISGNLIATGSDVTLNSVVQGDVFTGGETIKIGKDAVIRGNLLFGAAEIIIEGTVMGSVFGGAGTILFENGAEVGRNVYVGAYNMEVDAEAVINRDLYGGFYQIDLSGTVKEDVVMGADAVEFKGNIGGNLTLEISDPDTRMGMPTTFSFPGMENPPRTMQSGLDVDENAQLGGELKLITPVLIEPRFENIDEGVVTLEAPEEDDYNYNYNYADSKDDTSHPGFIFRWMRRNAGRFVALCVVGALLLWLCRKPFEETVTILKTQTWQSLGYGALAFFGGYLAFFLAAIAIVIVVVMFWFLTLGTLSPVIGSLGFSALGLVFAAFQLAVKFISKLVIIYWLGRVILKPQAGEKPGQAWVAALIGLVLFAVVRALPVLGWFIGATVTLFGLGAIILWCLNWWNERHSKKVVESVEDTEGSVEEYTLPEAN